MRSRCLTCSALALATAVAVSAAAIGPAAADHHEAGPWVALFDGKTLGDWQPNENKDAFSVADGCIVINGPRAHLFYMGQENQFENFHFRAEVKTDPNSNSGIYFHTDWQDQGWPQIGYESQVNVSHGDPVKSGSLYNTVKITADDIEKVGLSNDTWWVHEIIVRGKHVIVKLNGNVGTAFDEGYTSRQYLLCRFRGGQVCADRSTVPGFRRCNYRRPAGTLGYDRYIEAGKRRDPSRERVVDPESKKYPADRNNL